jgi:endoglucanase
MIRKPHAMRHKTPLAHLLAGLLISLMSVAAAASEPGFRRGINVGDYLAYPQSPTWPIFRGPRAETSDDELGRLKAAGLDFIRLPVEPGPMIDLPPEQVRVIEQRLVGFVARATRIGLKVIVTGWARHETTPGWRAPDILRAQTSSDLRRYLAFLKRVITLLADTPKSMWALAPFNEPQAACRRTDGPDWTELQVPIIKALRQADPALRLVVTTGCWSKHQGLDHLDMAPFDANTLVDLHYYDPWTFTHQSATWTVDWIRHLAGLSFPPSTTDKARATAASARLFTERKTDGGPAAFAETLRQIDLYVREDFGPDRIRADMARIATWAKRNKVAPERIILGEFGAYRAPAAAAVADDGSRMRWIETVRTAAEAERFGWAYYAYHSDFGLVIDEATARFDQPTLQALGLKPTTK